ncbi:MAG: hypothetical protein ACKKL5_03005 [Candidatus Komeilibacteria bacterium]
MNNYIVIPPYYKGTAFQEIVIHMLVAVKKTKYNIKFIGLLEPIDNTLSGFLLDDEIYTKYQSFLISDLMNLKTPAKILFLDFFNLGFDLLRYLHEQTNANVKYGSLIHGGSFFDEDIYNMPWLSNFENAWADLYDTMYIASNYGKNRLPDSFKDKVKVIPWGMDGFRSEASVNKINDVIFPHRLSPDKGVEDFIMIVDSLPQVKFIVTVPQKKSVISKNKYYNVLKKYTNVKFIFNESMENHNITLSSARVVLSCAKQEIFGYSIAKSVASGCIPVLPKDQCYPEFYQRKYLYKNIQDAISMIEDVIIESKSNTLSNEGNSKCIYDFETFSFKNHFDDFFG